MENLFQGLQMFQQGLQQYATSKAVGDATDALKQLNESALSDQEKRAEQMKLANNVAMHMTAIGASGQQTQAVSGAIKPQSFSSPEEMHMYGTLSGNKDLINAAESTRKMIDSTKFDLQKMQGQQAMDLQRLKSSTDLQQEYLKAALKKPEDVKVDPKEVEFLSNVKAGVQYTRNLENTIDKAGTWEGFRGLQNADAAAKLNSIPYQLALTSAKIKDPGSVVSGKEVEVAEKRLADLGFFQSKDKAKAAMLYLRADFKDAYKNRKESFKEFGGKYPEVKSLEHTPEESKVVGRVVAPVGSGLGPGQIIVPGVDPSTGKSGKYIYDTINKRNLGPWQGAD